LQGRDILVAKLSSGSSTTKSRKAIFLEGGIHAREWISSAALLNLIKLVLDQQEDLPECDIYILPLANPDG
jgi:murein tripeptide amidase MpaA